MVLSAVTDVQRCLHRNARNRIETATWRSAKTKAAEKKVESIDKFTSGTQRGNATLITPSPEILCKNDLPRDEVVSKARNYFIKPDLQGAKDWRQINRGDKLQKILGNKSVNMFE